jgi:predicted metal-dependent hydrolase
MTELVVRRLLVDLATPFEARWNGGDAFRSAFFSALSMSFPLGEQYFIDSVRTCFKALPEEQREKFAAEVQGFIGQEATHRRIHQLFNGHLERMGYVNKIEVIGAKRIQKAAHLDPRMHLAATAAVEHFTALFADWMLRHPEALEGAEERLQTLWLWHSAEESEHRSTAFNIYQASGGGPGWHGHGSGHPPGQSRARRPARTRVARVVHRDRDLSPRRHSPFLTIQHHVDAT